MIRRFAFASLLSFAASSLAQTAAAPKPVNSHEVNADHSLTFRYALPGASKVEVHLDLYTKPLEMTRGEDGVWSVTTPPLAPEYYGYGFEVDGRTVLDPLNPDVRFNYAFLANQVLVPGTPAAAWELTDIPHGALEHRTYTTHVAKNLPADQDAYVVYTPPGYDAKRKGGYPVLYLLHGWSDKETGWTEIGRAQLILDSLIDAGKAVPMIVVMPLGYGDLDFVTHGYSVWTEPVKIDANVNLFSQKLETEIMPAVDGRYNVAHGRENRAIVGLSMGGLESLYIGLNHTDQFAYIGGMSAAIHQQHFAEHLTGLTAKAPRPKLLWVACGTEDALITPNRAFVAWAKTQSLDVTAVETPGAHVWLVWRDNLVHFAPLLFRGK